MPFLTAEWRKLTLVNYIIDANILKNHIPYGTELDLWHGKCYLSLVGFMFVNTKLLGIKVPFHINFEEVNLRFYVKRKEGQEWKRGVVFIKEIVPRMALTLVANTIYHEHYETMPMTHRWQIANENQTISYSWKKSNQWHSITVQANTSSKEIGPNRETEFITEHYWGYAKVNDTKTNEYEVRHPIWRQYPIHDHQIQVDFEAVYGRDFAFLQDQQPISVMLAEGPEITVKKKKKIDL